MFTDMGAIRADEHEELANRFCRVAPEARFVS